DAFQRRLAEFDVAVAHATRFQRLDVLIWKREEREIRELWWIADPLRDAEGSAALEAFDVLDQPYIGAGRGVNPDRAEDRDFRFRNGIQQRGHRLAGEQRLSLRSCQPNA